MTTPTNPNNCATCDHKKDPQGGHCYMFKNAPTEVCMIHTPMPMEPSLEAGIRLIQFAAKHKDKR